MLLEMDCNRALLIAQIMAIMVSVGGCSQYEPLDETLIIREELAARMPAELAAQVVVPYELDETVRQDVEARLNPSGSERRRTEEILDFVFGGIDLRYSLTPTRNAVETYYTREGNCLSFVNLFVAIGRLQRLNPFYVEVEDYQRWNYHEGVVVSRGHIVAGMYVDGELSTFDFLPYQPKAYRDFEPITDLQAIAHYYNNLGAEALMGGDLEEANGDLQIAASLAPDFDKAVNNLGIVYLRTGETTRAIELYRRSLELHPDNVPLMTNLARAYQQEGEVEAAKELLERLEESNEANPFFYVYRGDLALADDDLETALRYMRKAYRTDSNLPEVHVGLVRVYLALGNFKQARHHVERALKLDATHEEARKYAAMLAQR